MMEHAKPVDPVSSASSDDLAKPAPRDATQSLFSLHDEAIEREDLAFSNCSEQPALTLVLPEEPAASSCTDDLDDGSSLSLVGEEDDAARADRRERSDSGDSDSTGADVPSGQAPESNLTSADDCERAGRSSASAESPIASSGSSIFSTAALRPISRPSRFILPDEAPDVGSLSRIELPKLSPAAQAPESATLSSERPPTAPAVIPSVASAAGPVPEKKTPPPVRVGSGQLQPNRINWKPGEPFGDSAATTNRFRWELMLTTACGTAACGLAGIWLLRTLLS